MVDEIFFEDFENGWGLWGADNGVWEIGIPSNNPITHPGQNYTGMAATILDGLYPDRTDSRLESRSFILPAIDMNQEIKLRFFHWFSLGGCRFLSSVFEDHGKVQVAEEISIGNWGPWTTVKTYNNSSGTWSRAIIDLSAYHGKKIKIGFLLDNDIRVSAYYSGDCISVDLGWYVDAVSIEVIRLD